MGQAVTVQRRVTIVLAGLLALTAVVVIAVPRPERADNSTPRTGGTTAADGDSETVQGTLPRDKVVRARVGDLVELTVTATQPDSASVPEFGLTDGTSPGAPARFSFLADHAGRFQVRLQLTNERVGWLRVK
jgi:hypothetical protein